MPCVFDPTLWTPAGPSADPRGIRFDTPFGAVEGCWWPSRIQLFHVRPVLAPPRAPGALPAIGERTESFGSLPRIGPLPAGSGSALVSARAADLVRQSQLWLGPAAQALETACILALRALARQTLDPAGRGDPNPDHLRASFSARALTFSFVVSSPVGLLPSGSPARPRHHVALKAVRLRPDGLLPVIRRLRRIRHDGFLVPVEALDLALPTFASAHARIAALRDAEARLLEAGADLDRMARDNGLAPLRLEIS
jgi:hypothetical protein